MQGVYLLLLLVVGAISGPGAVEQALPVPKHTAAASGAKAKKPVLPVGARQTQALAGPNWHNATRPVVLPAHEMRFDRIAAYEMWGKSGTRYRDSMLARPGPFWLEWGGLLYRARPNDTVFVRIKLERPAYPYGADDVFSPGNTSILFQDLNHDGSPEALVGFWRHPNGSGVRSSWVGINLIDVSSPPRLLLSATIEQTDSGWEPNPNKYAPSSSPEIFVTNGWERSVKLGGMDIRLPLMDDREHVEEVKSADPGIEVGKIFAGNGTSKTEKSTLTPLKPGRYRYQGGHLVWVRQ